MKESYWKKLLPAGITHLLFILSLFLVVSPQYWTNNITTVLFYKSISLSLLLLPIYLNQYLLIPRFFQRNKFLYWFALSKLLLFFTLLNYYHFKWIDQAYVPDYIQWNQPLLSFLFLFITLSIICAAAMFFKIMEMYREQKQFLLQKEQSRLESELEMLKLQISPHFLFNIMNTIYHSIKIDPEQAESSVLNLSQMMQYHIYECSKDKVSLQAEVKNINNYIGLQKMRLAKEPNMKIEISGNLSDKYIAPFILIPFVENAFKHGLEKHLNHSSLVISLDVNDHDLVFMIVNSKSIIGNNNGSEKGNGILNVKKRLALLYPGAHQLDINEDIQQFSVRLGMQLNGLSS